MPQIKYSSTRLQSWERIPDSQVVTLATGYQGKAIPLCMYRLLKAMPALSDGEHATPFRHYAEYERNLRGLFKKADIASIWGKARNWTTHSARVGGATTLLKAGYPVEIIQVLGDWKDVTVCQKYAREVILNPDCVCPYAFHNTRALAHQINAPAQEQVVPGPVQPVEIVGAPEPVQPVEDLDMAAAEAAALLGN